MCILSHTTSWKIGRIVCELKNVSIVIVNNIAITQIVETTDVRRFSFFFQLFKWRTEIVVKGSWNNLFCLPSRQLIQIMLDKQSRGRREGDKLNIIINS